MPTSLIVALVILAIVFALIGMLVRASKKGAVEEIKADTLANTAKEANEKQSRRARFLNDPDLRERLRTRNTPRS